MSNSGEFKPLPWKAKVPDYSTHAGTKALCEIIKNYWRKRGYEVTAVPRRIERGELPPSFNHGEGRPMFAIVSNLDEFGNPPRRGRIQ